MERPLTVGAFPVPRALANPTARLQMFAAVSGPMLYVFSADGEGLPQAVEFTIDLRSVPGGRRYRGRSIADRRRPTQLVLRFLARRMGLYDRRPSSFKVSSVSAQDVIHVKGPDVSSIFRISGTGSNDPARLFLAPSPADKVGTWPRRHR